MSNPIDILKERLEEIAIQLQSGLNNNLSEYHINKLTKHYNRYFIAIQLLDAHSEIDHKFSRLDTEGNKVKYRLASIKNHLKAKRKETTNG